jgi:hypothetical protein
MLISVLNVPPIMFLKQCKLLSSDCSLMHMVKGFEISNYKTYSKYSAIR